VLGAAGATSKQQAGVGFGAPPVQNAMEKDARPPLKHKQNRSQSSRPEARTALVVHTIQGTRGTMLRQLSSCGIRRAIRCRRRLCTSGEETTTVVGSKLLHPLPENWSTVVSGLYARTDFRPSELEDMWQQFTLLAGEKKFLTRDEFQRMIRRNFGIIKLEWVKKYFRAFDRNDSGTIDFSEYVLGFAAMGRVLTDKKAHSLIGLSTGSNIVRSGRDARLFWVEPPTRVAVIKKWKDNQVTKHAEDVIQWLVEEKGLTVLIEDCLDNEGQSWMPQCPRLDPSRVAEQVDFIVTLGGDGTALKAASYFDDSRPIPPTLAFGLGSLGFLAPFDIKDAQYMINRVLGAHRKPVACTLRTRLKGEVFSPSVSISLDVCSKSQTSLEFAACSLYIG
jgi:hypothetical protein